MTEVINQNKEKVWNTWKEKNKKKKTYTMGIVEEKGPCPLQQGWVEEK